MKISKLFHSLYALLMLAPVFAVGGAMAFNILNPNSVQNVETESVHVDNITKVYPYSTFDASSINPFTQGNLLVNHIYEIDWHELDTFIGYVTSNSENGSYYFRFNIYDFEFSTMYDGFSIEETLGGFTGIYNPDYFAYMTFEYDGFDYYNYFYFPFLGDDYYSAYSFFFTDVAVDHLYVILDEYYIEEFTQDFYDYSMQHIPLIFKQVSQDTYFKYVEGTPIDYEVVISGDTNLQDTFYSALDTMQDSPIFGWAKTSFLAEPFSYIFGLFGIPSGSPFITLLSYWLSISIIWLVFDLVMYVPLLVHGWIDKGGFE